VYSGALSEPACSRYVDGSDCVLMLGTFITDMFLGVNTARISRQRSILSTTERTRVGCTTTTACRLRISCAACGPEDPSRRRFATRTRPTLRPLRPSERHDPLTTHEVFDIIAHYVDENTAVVCDAGDSLFGAMGLRTAKRRSSSPARTTSRWVLRFRQASGHGRGSEETRVHHRRRRGLPDDRHGAVYRRQARHGPIVLILNMTATAPSASSSTADSTTSTLDYTKVCEVLRAGQAVVVHTKGQLDGALTNAVSSKELSIIEIRLPRTACSPALRRLGQELARLRSRARREAQKLAAIRPRPFRSA